MKKFKVIPVLLALVLAFSSWVPALATDVVAASPENLVAATSGPITLTITNPMPKATTVTLTGTKSYNILVPKGATITKTIDAGKYKYTYAGCLGKLKKGSLKVKGTTAALKIAPCKMAKYGFFNTDKTHTYYVKLKGWVSYSESVGPGQIKIFSWVAGTYQVTETYCGHTNTFTVAVKGNRGILLRPCG